MPYRMRDNLSCCVIDGHAVFLDIETDLYFCLPGDLERAFIAYAAGAKGAGAAIPMLVKRKILTPGKPLDHDMPPGQARAPLRSALEIPVLHAGSGMTAVPELMTTIWTCRRQIRAKPFKEVLDRAARYRRQRCPPRTDASGPAHEQQLLQAACIFNRARPYIPIATNCLLDSIALSRFLARRHFRSDIVLGVTHEPFSAHCWVQAGDIALNEAVGNAMAYTVIKVV
ncbi:lasso peptide biosynthesis B2 protein [Luteimonas sp. 22616]|jgi:hypothetical protein|uniref:lasso peptide biosynthesis B2 protein n=1 Tax=Luteimonas sp. 22616 TaxID=3453951 RepID=UPI003F83446B